MTSPEVERNKEVAPQEAIRTLDIRVTRAVLYPLSYKGKIHFGCTLARVAGMKPSQVLSLRRGRVIHPPAGTSHASFPRLRHVVLQRHTRNGADSRPRTDDIEFGKLTLCQLSYVRKCVKLATVQLLVRPHGKLLKTPSTLCDGSAITAWVEDCISAIGCW